MSYYSAFSVKKPETPQEAVSRLWRQSENLLEFISKLTRYDWHDGWDPKEFDEFNQLILKKLIIEALTP